MNRYLGLGYVASPILLSELAPNDKRGALVACTCLMTHLGLCLGFLGGYLLSWTPYGVVSLYRSFIGNDLSPLLGTLPAMFAKSTLVWSSIFYSYSNKHIRNKLFYQFKESKYIKLYFKRNISNSKRFG